MVDISETLSQVNLVALDVDGTLVDSRASQLATMNYFRTLFCKPEIEMSKFQETVMGLDLSQRADYLSELNNHQPIDKEWFLHRYDSIMMRAKHNYDSVIEGTQELISHLNKEDIPYVLISNASRGELGISEGMLLETVSGYNPIIPGVSAQELGKTKPHTMSMVHALKQSEISFDSPRIVCIGDSGADIEFARTIRNEVTPNTKGIYIGEKPNKMADLNYTSLAELVKNL